MSDSDVQRDLGRLDAQVENLTRSVNEMKTTLADMNETIQQAKGGWKVFVMFGTASAALGGLIVKFIPFFGAR